jgi:hypothetical protein
MVGVIPTTRSNRKRSKSRGEMDQAMAATPAALKTVKGTLESLSHFHIMGILPVSRGQGDGP